MNKLSVFDFKGQEVRIITQDGEPWFVAKDVCDILGISNSRQALTRLDEDEKNTVILNDGTPGNPNTVVVSESGMYALVLSSRKPEAKPFRKWVTSEVLTALRKTGSYSIESQRQLPNTVEYAQAAITIENLANPIIKSLLEQRMMEELTPTDRLLSGLVDPIPTYVILTVRAKELGYSEKRIGNGTQLGKFVSRLIAPVGKVQHGRYPVNTFELTPELDEAIHAYFR